jgi:sugar O-acyltransferase (sialic acid O-acetyltransferase NeuD family)
VALFDDDPRRQGLFVAGVPIVGPIERIAEQPRRPTVIAIGENTTRRRIAQRYDLPWLTVVHPQALVEPSVRLGQGTVILARAVVQVDSSLGNHVIVNHAATVDHDCVVESHAHLAPGVHLAGGVTVGEGVLLGIGAVAIPGVRICAGTTVGAGAAVGHDLPEHVVAVGVPAEIIKSRPDTVPCFNTAAHVDLGTVSIEP